MSRRVRSRNIATPVPSLISLAGKSGLITGSATGIGEAIAYRFAEAGADLHLVDIDNEGLSTVRRHLSESKVRTEIHNLDLSEKPRRDNLWEEFDRIPTSLSISGILLLYAFHK
jgi:short-subunit dehydrogenase